MLFGIQAYWAQLFQIPAKVMELIEAQCRSYIWSGTNTITKRALVSSDRICTPKCIGGLNLINPKLWNKAALLESFWDLTHKQDAMRMKWIHMFYIKGQQIDNMLKNIIETSSIVNHSKLQNLNRKSLIGQVYLHLLGDNIRVP